VLLRVNDHVDDPELSAWATVLDVAVVTGALWAASLLADVIAHLTVHGTWPHGVEGVPKNARRVTQTRPPHRRFNDPAELSGTAIAGENGPAA
jgi:hypothetical protein